MMGSGGLMPLGVGVFDLLFVNIYLVFFISFGYFVVVLRPFFSPYYFCNGGKVYCFKF